MGISTWFLNTIPYAIWYPGLDPRAEIGINGKTGEILMKSTVSLVVS